MEAIPYSPPRALGPTSRNLIMERATDLINGDRADEYGEARSTHANIGRLWATLLSHRTGLHIDDLEPELVALMMICVKQIRAARNPDSFDSWVDIAGYAALGGEFTGANA